MKARFAGRGDLKAWKKKREEREVRKMDAKLKMKKREAEALVEQAVKNGMTVTVDLTKHTGNMLIEGIRETVKEVGEAQ